MSIVYKIDRLNEEGTPDLTIAHVSDDELADRLALGQGPYGREGKITVVDVYDSFDELPNELRERVMKEEAKRDDKTAKAVKEFLDSTSELPKEKREEVLKQLEKGLKS